MQVWNINALTFAVIWLGRSAVRAEVQRCRWSVEFRRLRWGAAAHCCQREMHQRVRGLLIWQQRIGLSEHSVPTGTCIVASIHACSSHRRQVPVVPYSDKANATAQRPIAVIHIYTQICDRMRVLSCSCVWPDIGSDRDIRIVLLQIIASYKIRAVVSASNM